MSGTRPGVPVPHIAPPKARLLEWLKHPLWKGQPVWLFNILKFKRDARGSTAAAEASFRAYVSAGDQRRVVLTAYTARSAGTTLDADAVIIAEYASPSEFVSVASVLPASSHSLRAAALDACEIFAVRRPAGPLWPSAHPSPAGGSPAGDPLWRDTVAREPAGDPAEGQVVKPETEAVTGFMRDRRFDDGHLYAINLLRYRRPEGRRQWLANAKAAGRMPHPICEVPASPCFTLLGDTRWDEFAVMGYPNKRAFAQLSEQREHEEAARGREEGLLKQGFVWAVRPEGHGSKL